MATYTCEVCGRLFKGFPSRVKEGKEKYCSRKCSALGCRKLTDEEVLSMWKKVKEESLTPEEIGRTINASYATFRRAIKRLVAEDERKTQFIKLKREQKLASKNPNWKGGKSIKRQCIHCGKAFYAYPSQVEKDQAVFCSKSCHAKHNPISVGKLYIRGRHFEWRVRDHLIKQGYFVSRSPASRSPVDLIAIKKGEGLLVQCKTTPRLSKKDAQILKSLADSIGFKAILSYRVRTRNYPIVMREIN